MRITAMTLLTATATTAALALAPAAEASSGVDAAGLAAGGTKVTTFAIADGDAAKPVKLTGLTGDRALVGIDYRSYDGQLYGVGDGGGLYRVNPESGDTAKVGQLTVALSGTSFGVDFNPAANALRVISDTGQNLRQSFVALFDNDPATTQANTLVDGPLNYAGSTAAGVTGAAYTNNDADGAPAPAGQPSNGNTGTALYDIDTRNDSLVLQNPPNSGTLSTVGTGLGVDTSDVVGFDIFSRITDGKATSNAAYAVLTVAGERGLYSIDLGTGAASLITRVTRGVSDIAVMP